MIDSYLWLSQFPMSFTARVVNILVRFSSWSAFFSALMDDLSLLQGRGERRGQRRAGRSRLRHAVRRDCQGVSDIRSLDPRQES